MRRIAFINRTWARPTTLLGLLLACFILLPMESHAQWYLTGLRVWTNSLFPTDSSILACTRSNGILASSDDGLTWTGMNNGLIYTDVRSIGENETHIFAGTSGGVFRSSNAGVQWTLVNTGLSGGAVNSLAIIDTFLFAATASAGVFVSTDNGTHWNESNSGLTNMDTRAFSSLSGYLFVGTYGGGVFRTSDGGVNWTAVNVGLTNRYVGFLTVAQEYLFAGTLAGVFRSIDFGASWETVNSGLTNLQVEGLGTDGSNVFAGFHDQVFLLRYGEDSWVDKSEGLAPANQVYSIALKGDYLFAGTWGGVCVRPYSEITSVRTTPIEAPSDFMLVQNYPNPFNQSTRIQFHLMRAELVELEVFDMLGRNVATVVREGLSPGSHIFTFDAKGLSSGAYFYQLRAGRFSQTKKLVLEK